VVRRVVAEHLEIAQHSHSVYTAATVVEGRLNGAVGETGVTVTAGETLLIDPGQIHQARLSHCELVSVGIQPFLLDELLQGIGWYREGSTPAFRNPLTGDEDVARSAGAIGAEVLADQPGRGLMLAAMVRGVAIHLVRRHLRLLHLPEIELSRVGPVDRRLRRAVELMHDHCAEELSLKDLAGAVFLSEHYFAHLFRQITGLTPHAYLANLRIERARALLAHTETSVTEIASQVGYRSPSHFAHAFRAVTGASPRGFRSASQPTSSLGGLPPRRR
jgi:AraC family transcriptional regulator